MNEVAYERNSRTQSLEVCTKITVKVRVYDENENRVKIIPCVRFL